MLNCNAKYCTVAVTEMRYTSVNYTGAYSNCVWLYCTVPWRAVVNTEMNSRVP